MKTGVIIKEIRKAKKIKSKELYKELLSRPGIVKFENGESDTTTHKFFLMLERLNITLEEFDMLIKRKENRDIFYTSNYIKKFYENNIDGLFQLAQNADNEFTITRNVKFCHYKAICYLLIDDLTGKKDYENEGYILQNYLMQCNTWGYYELTLFINSLSFYSNELIDLVYRKAKRNLINFNTMARYQNELFILLLNILEKKVRSLNFQKVDYYLNEIENIDNTNKEQMYFNTMKKFFSELIYLSKTENENGVEDIKKIIEIMRFLNMDFKAKQCEDLLEFVVLNFKRIVK